VLGKKKINRNKQDNFYLHEIINYKEING